MGRPGPAPARAEDIGASLPGPGGSLGPKRAEATYDGPLGWHYQAPPPKTLPWARGVPVESPFGADPKVKASPNPKPKKRPRWCLDNPAPEGAEEEEEEEESDCTAS